MDEGILKEMLEFEEILQEANGIQVEIRAFKESLGNYDEEASLDDCYLQIRSSSVEEHLDTH